MNHLYHRKFLILILVLLTLLLLQPQIVEYKRGPAVLGIITSLLQIVAIVAVSEDRVTRICAGVFGLPAIVAILGSTLCSAESMETVMLWAHGLGALFFALTAMLILRHVLTYKVTTDNVLGALAAYLLIGVAMGQVYVVLESLHPHSFKASSEIGHALANFHTRVSSLIYYSFATLTTSGYGDIIPAAPLSRTLSWMEAVAGQFYLAVLVAGLIGMRVSQSGLTRPEGSSGGMPIR